MHLCSSWCWSLSGYFKVKIVVEEEEQLLHDLQSKMKWVISFKFKEKYMRIEVKVIDLFYYNEVHFR